MGDCFIRGSVIRYIHLSKLDVDEDLLLNISYNCAVVKRFPSSPRCENRGGRTLQIVLLCSMKQFVLITKVAEEVPLFFRRLEGLAHERDASDRRKTLRGKRPLKLREEGVDGHHGHAPTIISISKGSEGVQMDRRWLVHIHHKCSDRHSRLLRQSHPLAARLCLIHPKRRYAHGWIRVVHHHRLLHLQRALRLALTLAQRLQHVLAHSLVVLEEGFANMALP